MKKIGKCTCLAAAAVLLGCSQSARLYNDGVYRGSAEGHNGEVTVEVTVTDGKISEVNVTEHTESDGQADRALELIPQAIAEAGRADHEIIDYDAVSGCTDTAEAIADAAANALKKAGQ